jgi:hypothetical protein
MATDPRNLSRPKRDESTHQHNAAAVCVSALPSRDGSAFGACVGGLGCVLAGAPADISPGGASAHQASEWGAAELNEVAGGEASDVAHAADKVDHLPRTR